MEPSKTISSTVIFDNLTNKIKDDSRFLDLYRKLLKHQYFRNHLELLYLNAEEIKFMLECASIFSNSSNDTLKQVAYKIASIISLNYSEEYDQINSIIQYIFISIGQLPVVKKNTDDGHADYFSIYSESNIQFNPIKFRDVIVKQIKNRLPIEIEKEPIFLTDFQSELFRNLEKGESVSISAPTSSGKSFLLKAFICKKFKENDNFNVVYLVPTRALISEITRDFKNSFKKFELNDVNVSSAPSSYDKDNTSPQNMFVFTQERLHMLLYDCEFDQKLDLIIIDEAQKVSDGSRGITLEEVIEEILNRYPEIQTVFITPNSKNPQKFAKMFHLDNLLPAKTKISPVSQNLLLLNTTDIKYSLQLSTAELDDILPISMGEINYQEKNFFSESDDWALLWAAKKFGDEFNIVYCNSPNKCRNNALFFAQSLPEFFDLEIENAIKFLEDNIHEQYYLIDCLKKGVAYHHGKMPSQIRKIIEKLFRNKKLKYVFCTSTLLEGVNFPAQNIFLHKPKVGRSSMKKLDFWNLAGRAGRLLKDYYGNIYCINIENWRKFKPDPKDVENEIESILETTFLTKNKEIMAYLENIYFNLKKNEKHIEQAITKFIIQELKSGKTDFITEFLARNPNFEADKIEAIKEEIEQLAKGIDIPPKILQKNSSIDPRLQQKLLEKFEKNLITILPPNPTKAGFNAGLNELYKFINKFFRDRDDESYTYFSWLTQQWVYNQSLHDIIYDRIKYKERNAIQTTDQINNEIETTFKSINSVLRFEYQKFLKCYTDILKHHYEKSEYEPARFCENLSTYIEFGSFNKNVILLQSVGLSRSTAIKISSFASGLEFTTESDCIHWLKSNKERIKRSVSSIYFDEIEEIV